MATSDKTRPPVEVPRDLLPSLHASKILSERQFEEVRDKVKTGKYPLDSVELARRLIRDNLLTEYQARKLLSGKMSALAIGRYIILDRIGSGSMGRVYKAQHSLMGRVVALKVIAPEIATNSRVISRFQREMRMIGRLDHPNVVRAFDADKLGSMLYIVMEYIPGLSVGNHLRARGLLSPLDAAEFGGQAALGLAHAHSQGIVHRDIKPSNLLIDDRQLKILDLGLGTLLEADENTNFATADGITVGTVDYMSPEQAQGGVVDGRSDLFSLGCTLYHAVAGKIPFPGDSPLDRLGKRIRTRHVPIESLRPDVPPEFIRVLDRLMAKAPADRYGTASEAAEALFALSRFRTPPIITLASTPTGVGNPTEPQSDEDYESLASDFVETAPEFPAWFRPLARLAESRPALALLALIGGAILALAIGLVLGWMVS